MITFDDGLLDFTDYRPTIKAPQEHQMVVSHLLMDIRSKNKQDGHSPQKLRRGGAPKQFLKK